MQPLLQPSSKMEPAVSKDAMGITSWVCQCCVIACQTPNLPEGDSATNWLPIKNKYSTLTWRLNVPAQKTLSKHLRSNHLCTLPMFVLFPESDIPHKRTWLPWEMATIFEVSGDPILAFIAIRSMQLSMKGLVKTCCHPLESFNLNIKYRILTFEISFLNTSLNNTKSFKAWKSCLNIMCLVCVLTLEQPGCSPFLDRPPGQI